ncbi:3-deoxy-7-phosphoheptulonate synthase [bacterium]|nr:3-deoxy-7-phosphoheptulonate synthase [bacterium]
MRIGQLEVGGPQFTVIAGPCSVESREQFFQTSSFVKSKGAQALRGGLFKLRTDPSTFQGLGVNAYQLAKEVKSELGLPFISEITDPRQMSDLDDVVDAYQVGSRNMHNYSLLKELGMSNKPVLLKRGLAALFKEWILAAEHIVKSGNDQIILCERGIRTFETSTRNTLDLNSVALAKQETHFPVLADPSHGTGMASLVTPMALASAAAGADGLLIEVHPDPSKALSDGFQSLNFEQFENLMNRLNLVLPALDRKSF